jgi:uncharacterized membrane protein (TIGR02234 family)
MSSRPGPPLRYGPTLLVGLVGALAVTVGVTKPWATATGHQAGLPTIRAGVTGADLVPLAGALGVVVLASFGAVLATRGWVRRAVGVLIVVAALVVLVSAVHPPGATDALKDGLAAKGWSSGGIDTATTAWRWVALAGAVLSLCSGAAIARFGARWATMGQEYDAPRVGTTTAQTTSATTTEEPSKRDEEHLTEADVWREIDQGRDPTRRDGA